MNDGDLVVDVYVATQADSMDVESLLREIFTPRSGFIAPIDEHLIGTCQWYGNIYVISTMPLLEGSLTGNSVTVSGVWIQAQLFGALDKGDSIEQLLDSAGFESYTNDLEDDRVIPEGYELTYGCGNFSVIHYSNSVNFPVRSRLRTHNQKQLKAARQMAP